MAGNCVPLTLAGDFPLWLAPTQLRLLPVSDDFLPYCAEVKALVRLVASQESARVLGLQPPPLGVCWGCSFHRLGYTGTAASSACLARTPGPQPYRSLRHLPRLTPRLQANKAGLRVELDPGGRSLGKQIKVANAEKIPLYTVVGAKEVEGRTLALNFRPGDGAKVLDLD